MTHKPNIIFQTELEIKEKGTYATPNAQNNQRKEGWFELDKTTCQSKAERTFGKRMKIDNPE